MQTFLLLFSLLASLLIVFTLEKKTAKRYLLVVAFLFGLSLVSSTLLSETTAPFLRGVVSFGVMYSLITGLALLFQIYAKYPEEASE